jgi:ribosome biogenesis GTPase A
MAKAIRQIKEKRSKIDIILEVLDARVPLSSRNPVLNEVFPSKPRLLLLSKADLADPIVTNKWLTYFKKKGLAAITVNALSGKEAQKIEKAAKKVIANSPSEKKTSEADIIRGVVFGIPNVGKSSLINHLIGKRKTIIADRPGVTKKQDWLVVSKKFLLLDTPGILWPKFEDPNIGFKLAIVNCIKEKRYNFEEIVFYLFKYLLKTYPQSINSRFNLESPMEEPLAMLEEIGRKRGCYLSGNEIDYDRVYDLFIREFRSGKMGRISLETPA